jgi:hypothetical protein
MSATENVCKQLDPKTGEPIDAITATGLRRHFGNTLVHPAISWRQALREADEWVRRNQAASPSTPTPECVTIELTEDQARASGVIPECFRPIDGVRFELRIRL